MNEKKFDMYFNICYNRSRSEFSNLLYDCFEINSKVDMKSVESYCATNLQFCGFEGQSIFRYFEDLYDFLSGDAEQLKYGEKTGILTLNDFNSDVNFFIKNLIMFFNRKKRDFYFSKKYIKKQSYNPELNEYFYFLINDDEVINTSDNIIYFFNKKISLQKLKKLRLSKKPFYLIWTDALMQSLTEFENYIKENTHNKRILSI